MIDFDKQNTHIHFVNSVNEIKAENLAVKDLEEEYENEPRQEMRLSKNKEEEFIHLLKQQ